MNQIFEELKARILSDLKENVHPEHFCFTSGEVGHVMACAAASAEERPLELPGEGFIPHPMTGDERGAILRKFRWGAQAIELGHKLAGKGDSGKLTPRQLRAAHVLALAGIHSTHEADVVFLDSKNAHAFCEETEAAIIQKREELKNSFENLKTAFNEYRSYLPADESARLAKLFAPEDASLVVPEDAPEPASDKHIYKQPRQENAILEALRGLRYDPLALPRRTPGKAWVKSEIWKILGSDKSLFLSYGVFDGAWERLRALGRAGDADGIKEG